jgi:hypothetical protein
MAYAPACEYIGKVYAWDYIPVGGFTAYEKTVFEEMNVKGYGSAQRKYAEEQRIEVEKYQEAEHRWITTAMGAYSRLYCSTQLHFSQFYDFVNRVIDVVLLSAERRFHWLDEIPLNGDLNKQKVVKDLKHAAREWIPLMYKMHGEKFDVRARLLNAVNTDTIREDEHQEVEKAEEESIKRQIEKLHPCETGDGEDDVNN